MITASGPDVFTVVGFTAGTSGGASFTHNAVFIDDAAMTGNVRAGPAHPARRAAFRPRRHGRQVASEVHDKLGASVTTYDPRAGAASPLQDLEPLLLLVTVLSLIVGAGVTANSAALAAFERRREIGLLRAAGASSRQVFRLFAAEVGLVGLAGVPIGILVGFALAAIFQANLSPGDLAAPSLTPSALQVLAASSRGSALRWPADCCRCLLQRDCRSSTRCAPIRSATKSASPFVVVAAPTLLIIALLCFISTDSGIVALGVVSFLLGVVMALPVIAPVLIGLIAKALSPFVAGAEPGAAHLARARNRTAITAAGLAVSVATAVGVSALSAGALTASDSWISHLFVGNVLITSPVTQEDQVASAIQSSPGVARATPLRLLSETVAGASEGVTAIDPAAYASLGGFDFVLRSRATALPDLEDGPSSSSRRAGRRTGGPSVPRCRSRPRRDSCTSRSWAWSVTRFPAGDGSESLVMADDLARTYFGSAADGFDDLVVTTQGSATSVVATAATYGMRRSRRGHRRRRARRGRALDRARPRGRAHRRPHRHARRREHTARQRTAGNTRAGIAARGGLGSRQAMRRVLTESGLLAGAAMLIGVGAGCIMALAMLRASTTPAFTPGFVFPAETVIVLIAVVVLGGLVATIGPARRAVRTSVLSALRHE